MGRSVLITTSWDDGHPCDLRVAELLRKHGLCGTFYVPQSFHGRAALSPHAYTDFGQDIEVGAHTMNHIMLTKEDEQTTEREIIDSKAFIEDHTGENCKMFCPPWGRFNATHVRQCARAGFMGLRTVEAWSLEAPKGVDRIVVVPTSVQALTVPCVSHLRNLTKRISIRGLMNWARFGRCGSWELAASRLLAHAHAHGGVLHLWGHSWEVDEHKQWDALERVLGRLGEFCARGTGVAVTNGRLVERFNVPLAEPTRVEPPPPRGSVLATQANWAKRHIPQNVDHAPPAYDSAKSTETSGVHRSFLAQTFDLKRWLRPFPARRGRFDSTATLPHGGLASAVRRIARVPRSR